MIPLDVLLGRFRERGGATPPGSPVFLLYPDTAPSEDPLLSTRKIQASIPEDWLTKTMPDGRLPPLPALQPQTPTPTHAVAITKSRTNPSPFPNMVTVGRMETNDLVLPFSAVSKVHAIVLRGSHDDEWFLQDQSSTNGTWLGSERLTPKLKVRLPDNGWVNLGASLGMRFLLPGSLLEFLSAHDEGRP